MCKENIEVNVITVTAIRYKDAVMMTVEANDQPVRHAIMSVQDGVYTDLVDVADAVHP